MSGRCSASAIEVLYSTVLTSSSGVFLSLVQMMCCGYASIQGRPRPTTPQLPPRLPLPMHLHTRSTRLCLFTSFPWTAARAHALTHAHALQGTAAHHRPKPEEGLSERRGGEGHKGHKGQKGQEEFKSQQGPRGPPSFPGRSTGSPGAPWVAHAAAEASERYGGPWSGVLWAADATETLLYNAPCAADLRNLVGLHNPARPGALVPIAAALGAPGPSPAAPGAPAAAPREAGGRNPAVYPAEQGYSKGSARGTPGEGPSVLSLFCFKAEMRASRLLLLLPGAGEDRKTMPGAWAAPFIGVSDNSVSGQLSNCPGMVSVSARTQHVPVHVGRSTLAPVLALVRGLRAAWAATEPFRPLPPPHAPPSDDLRSGLFHSHRPWQRHAPGTHRACPETGNRESSVPGGSEARAEKALGSEDTSTEGLAGEAGVEAGPRGESLGGESDGDTVPKGCVTWGNSLAPEDRQLANPEYGGGWICWR